MLPNAPFCIQQLFAWPKHLAKIRIFLCFSFWTLEDRPAKHPFGWLSLPGFALGPVCVANVEGGPCLLNRELWILATSNL